MAIQGPTNFRADKTTAKPGEEIIFTWTSAAGDFDGYIYEYSAPNCMGVGLIESNTSTSFRKKMPDYSLVGYEPDDYFEVSIFAVKGMRTTGDYDEKGPTTSVKVYYDVSGGDTPVTAMTGKLEQFQNSEGEQIYPQTIIEGIFRQSDSKPLSELLSEGMGGVGLSMAGETVEPVQGEKVAGEYGAEIFNDYRERKFSDDGSAESGNIASGSYSHAEGGCATASGECSHAEGVQTAASGNASHAGGLGTIASGAVQTAIGQNNVEYAGLTARYINLDAWFIIGKGGSESARSNAFRVASTGVYASGSYNASGADYAEMFEWADGNPDKEDRRGLFVTLDGAKIRLAGRKMIIFWVSCPATRP